jgi:6-phosphogluconolactonase/glucosamine-6-phosphate isomerase/deaminase
MMKKLSLLEILLLAVTAIFFNRISAQQQSSLDWSKFDFVPGDEIIFEDNLEGERNGELTEEEFEDK